MADSVARKNIAVLSSVSFAVLLVGLFSSGVASMINQVVWQRSIKLYLAGSEAFSSMLVVLVFMGGLGFGSQLVARRAARLRNPLAIFVLVELLLALINGGICFALGLDIADGIYALQRLAVSMGIPLQWVYAGMALAILVVPCVLMGATVPLAAEGLQRQLQRTNPRLLVFLFVLNTFGALIGTVASGAWILPLWGQRIGLLLAISLNAAAGLAVAFLAWSCPRRVASAPQVAPEEPSNPQMSSALEIELVAGLVLGFVALAYEIYLFRVFSLVLTPRPFVFSLVLAGFLLFWTAGNYMGRRARDLVRPVMAATAIGLAVVPLMYRCSRWPEWELVSRLVDTQLFLFASMAPCLGFGFLFSQLVTRFARSWGYDVGRYYAFNTLGSCLGVVAAYALGSEAAPFWTAISLAGCTAALLFVFDARDRQSPSSSVVRMAVLFAGTGLILVYGASWVTSGGKIEGQSIAGAWYGKSGVLELTADGDLIWDGLWHSQLSSGDDHIGTANWLTAMVPILSYPTGSEPLSAAVIGLGTGITAATVARSDRVATVDVYEINRDLEEFLRTYPEGSLRVLDNDKIQVFWGDGRSGLALSEAKYDLLTQQPLYLVQAGSSLLLSEEYMQLVRSRLNPGGVFAIYSNANTAFADDSQALLVRATAAAVFAHCESFGNGYMIICSDRPIRFTPSAIAERAAAESTLARELASYTQESMADYLDQPRLVWDAPYLITDDHPLVEYPNAARELVGAGSASGTD